FFSSRRRHTRWPRDWSSDVCSSDLVAQRSGSIGGERFTPIDPERWATERRYLEDDGPRALAAFRERRAASLGALVTAVPSRLTRSEEGRGGEVGSGEGCVGDCREI